MIEMWKDIKGFEGLYQISDQGNVKNKYKRLNPKITNTGYKTVSLSKKGKRFHCFIHRLVLSTFTHQSHLHVNHKDGNKLNNHLSNLEFVTHIKNCNHYALDLKKQTRYGVHYHKKGRKWVASIDIKNYPIYLGWFDDKETAYEIFYLNYVCFHGVTPW